MQDPSAPENETLFAVRRGTVLRIGIIGAGFIGLQHAQAYALQSAAQLACVADADAKTAAFAGERFGVPCYCDPAEMLDAESLDAVDICVPTFLHERFVKLAASRGKHVLCEKPFALDEQACRRMMDACEEAGVRLMVGQSERWAAHIVKIKALLDEGLFEGIHMASFSRLAQHPAWTAWHRDPAKSGGGLYDLQVHDVDLAVWFFGEVGSVYALGWKSPAGCWNHVIASLRFKNGVTAWVESSLEMNDGYPFSCMVRLTGDKGGAEYQYRGSNNLEQCPDPMVRFCLYAQGGESVFPALPDSNDYAQEIAAFANGIKAGGELPVPPSVSAYVIRVSDAIRRSLETGETVALP